MCKLNTHRIYEEYTILLFEFDLCGLRHRQDATNPTLDNDTGSERMFQRQEKVRYDSTGRYHAPDNIVRIMYRRWYLPEKNQERMQIQNLLQELSQKKIYVNYPLPVRQSSHRNIMNYSFNKFFNNLRIWRVKF